MKKTLLILFTLISLGTHAQIQKKTLLLGGFTNLYYNNNDDAYININPNTGIFLSDNFCMGISMPFLLSNFNDDVGVMWGLVPNGRYYYNTQETKSPFISTSLNVSKILGVDADFDYPPLTAGIGYAWFLNSSVGFEGEIVFGSDIRVYTTFGFQIYFER